MQINQQTKIDQQTTLLLLHHQTWFKSLSWPLFSSHNLFPKTLLSRWTTDSDSDSLDGFVAYKFRIAACQWDNMLVWLATIDWGEFIIWKCHNLFKFAHSTIPSSTHPPLHTKYVPIVCSFTLVHHSNNGLCLYWFLHLFSIFEERERQGWSLSAASFGFISFFS